MIVPGCIMIARSTFATAAKAEKAASLTSGVPSLRHYKELNITLDQTTSPSIHKPSTQIANDTNQ